MSSMASNYDTDKLVLGQVIVTGALLLALTAAYLSAGLDSQSLPSFAFISLAYGAMMFASSYVEEEHHFWYWSLTAWLVLSNIQGLDGYGA